MHTNVARALENGPVDYRVHNHADYAPIKSPQDFALALNYSISRISKTLFVRSPSRDAQALIVCRMDKKVDFARVAVALGCSRLEIAGRSELLEQTGYPPTGVSPLGVDNMPVFMDEGLLHFDTILVGAGQAGVEVEIPPCSLAKRCGARTIALTV